MTIEELIAGIKKINKEEDGDPETSHFEIDKLLLKFIGDPEIEKLYGKLPKWYA